MIHHIVLFKFYESARPEEINQLAAALKLLSKQIPGVSHYVWGPSVSSEHLEKGYTHGFIMTFASKQDRDNYLPHPLHKELVNKYVNPICDLGISFDIEE